MQRAVRRLIAPPGPSNTNFVLLRGPRAARAAFAHGILVCDSSSYGLSERVRIAGPDHAGSARLAFLWRGGLMVGGTASDVGKGSVVAGRRLHRQRVSVPPHRQNIANSRS